MLGIFIVYPYLAFVLGLGLQLLGRWSRSRVALWTGTLWVAYGTYEYAMKARVLCTGECNIRVDLLLIYPVLGILTLFALISAARRWGEASPDSNPS